MTTAVLPFSLDTTVIVLSLREAVAISGFSVKTLKSPPPSLILNDADSLTFTLRVSVSIDNVAVLVSTGIGSSLLLQADIKHTLVKVINIVYK